MPDFYRRACAAHELGRPREAIRELHQSLGQNPDDAASHALLAMCLCAVEDYASGLTAAERAIGLDPEMGYAHYARAWILKSQGRYARAHEAIVEALRIEPLRASYWSCRAEIESRDNREVAALESTAQGLECDPQHVSCLIWRAQALRVLRRLGESLEVAQRAVAIDPETSDAQAAVGWAYLDQGRGAKALAYFREARRLKPDSQWARNGYRQALASGWGNLVVWLGLALACARLSVSAFDSVAQAEPRNEGLPFLMLILAVAFIERFFREGFVFGSAEGRQFLAREEPAEWLAWTHFCCWLACGALPLLNESLAAPWIAAATLLPTTVALRRSRQRWLTVGLSGVALLQSVLAALSLAAWHGQWAGTATFWMGSTMVVTSVLIWVACGQRDMPGAESPWEAAG